MTERGWHSAPSRCHTAGYVYLVCRGALRSAQAAGRRMRTMRHDEPIANGAGSAHAALPPTPRSGCEPVVQRLAARLHDAVHLVPFQNGPPGPPRREPDPPRHAHRAALPGLRPADDVRATWRYSSRLPGRHTAIRPLGVHADGLTPLSEIEPRPLGPQRPNHCRIPRQLHSERKHTR